MVKKEHLLFASSGKPAGGRLSQLIYFSRGWLQALLFILLGLYTIRLENLSFGTSDFSEFNWLIAFTLSLTLFVIVYFASHKMTPELWVVCGVTGWLLWRFMDWIFISRAGFVVGIIGLLTLPFRDLLRIPTPADFLMHWISFDLILLGFLTNYWIYKNFDLKWLKQGAFLWTILIAIIIAIAILSSQPVNQTHCYGFNAYSQVLPCKIWGQLGVLGRIWGTLTFLFCGITLALRFSRNQAMSGYLWIIGFTPLWIAMFFDPAHILAAASLQQSRVGKIAGSLDINILDLHLIPLVIFFILLPISFLILQSGKVRTWWTLMASGIVLTGMVSYTFYALFRENLMGLFSTSEHALIVLMALQLWLPYLLVAALEKEKLEKMDSEVSSS